MVKKIGIIGLGTVGQATLKTLAKYRRLIERRTSLDIRVQKVCDIKQEKKKVVARTSIPFTTDPYEVINDPNIDIIVELIGGIHPAYQYVTSSLKKGKDVVTANKALLAQEGKAIFKLAHKLKCNVGVEASVCGAMPLIKSISEGLVSCEVKRLYGILNGTTNHILYQMYKEKIDFQDALKQAQERGIAETSPQLDIQGTDALHKLCILSYLCFGVWPKIKDVYVEGITRINPLDIQYAEELSYRIKLLAIAKKEKYHLSLRVHPTLIREEHPLAEVVSAFNGVWLDTYPAGRFLMYGEGAGGIPTSSSIISDIVNVSLRKNSFKIKEEKKTRLESINRLKTRYYIRFMALDKPGVLARVSKILASLNISIASVTQKERSKGNIVPIVMLTHDAIELNLRKALSRIDRLDLIKPPSQLIRIEDM